MRSLLGSARSAILLLALAASARASTWIVDVNGGPGAHFTDIPPAIAAAAPGDVILVRGGSYSAFNLSKGLTIIGTQGSTYISCCIPPQTVVTTPGGQVTLLADMHIQSPLNVTQSAGIVIMDRLDTTFRNVTISQCADVRIHRHTGRAISVADSHFEIANSNLIGQASSSDGDTALSIYGGNGLVTRTSCLGGAGLSIPIGIPGDGGNGGMGIFVGYSAANPLTTLLLAGGGVSTVRGGNGGTSYIGNYGNDADGFYNSKCGVWRSGCTFIAGSYTGSGAVPVRYVPGPGSFDTPVVPDDPTLEIIGSPTPGGTTQLDVFATPGSIVRLVIGMVPTLISTPPVRVEKLVLPGQVIFLGVVPATGMISYTMPLRPGYSPGTTFYAQAYVADTTAGESRRTNSVPIIVR